MKLRKKLEVFKEHLPEIHPFTSEVPVEQEPSGKNTSANNRIDIATILKKKTEQTSTVREITKPKDEPLPSLPIILRKE